MPDLERMLRSVALDVFDEDVEVTWDTEEAPHVIRATLSAEHGSERRTARLEASTSGWFGVYVPEFGVGTFRIEYDDESDMAEILGELALIAEAYLRGNGRVERQRGLFRTRTVLTIAVDGSERTLTQPLFGRR